MYLPGYCVAPGVRWVGSRHTGCTGASAIVQVATPGRPTGNAMAGAGFTARSIAVGQPETSISRRQWSLAPHSSTEFMARTLTLLWKPREAIA